MEDAATGIPMPGVGPVRMRRLAGDERLVALARAGDERAFEVLYDRHHRPILAFCRHMLGSREEAEDAVQHTFLAAYRDLLASEKPIRVRPWLFAIARNRCLSILRARRPQVPLDAAEPSTDGLAARVEQREDVRELLGDLARLPDDQRAALLLAELGALDHDGIAAVLGCRREKVKALVFQARSSLAADREARAIPCAEIRARLASASGGELRAGPLRRHLRDCPGCRAFKAEVARQRQLLGIALPVVPTAALKAGALAGLGGGGAAGGATAAAAASGGGLAAALGGGSIAKLAVGLTLAGSIAGGGAVAIEAVSDHAGAPARIETPAADPAATSAPAMPLATTPSQAGRRARSARPARDVPADHRAQSRPTAPPGRAKTGEPPRRGARPQGAEPPRAHPPRAGDKRAPAAGERGAPAAPRNDDAPRPDTGRPEAPGRGAIPEVPPAVPPQAPPAGKAPPVQ